jgi:hypothetical protein
MSCPRVGWCGAYCGSVDKFTAEPGGTAAVLQGERAEAQELREMCKGLHISRIRNQIFSSFS